MYARIAHIIWVGHVRMKILYDKVIETVGNSAKWSSITKAIRENIIDSGKMRETCGKCQWSDICFKN